MCPTHTRSDQHTNPAKGVRASSQRSWQTGIQMATAHSTMTFKNEVVSDADIDRYKLPFPKGEGRWWTRDAERDYYLWGGLVGNLAYEETQEGRFHLYINGVEFKVFIQPASPFNTEESKETIFSWKKIEEIRPRTSKTESREIIQILKEALSCYGFDGRRNIFYPEFKVKFGF
jgi:hypothetical protein